MTHSIRLAKKSLRYAGKISKKAIKAFQEERIKHKDRVVQNRRTKAHIVKAIRESNLSPSMQSREIHKLRESRFTKLKKRFFN